MNANNSKPIGVFDSGVGGLTVVRALMNACPMKTLFISATPRACLTA